MSDSDAPDYVEHQVQHFQQRYNWDCGVSCVMMLLSPEQRKVMLDTFTEICQEEGFRQSTWTIDLCYLLKRFNIKHSMYTTMPGVNEEYKKHSYYQKIINMDRDRVLRRFESAAADGIDVRRGRLTAAQVVTHVRTRGPVLLLVDAGLLVCDLCKHNKLRAEFRRWFGGGYRGHYILVVGHHARRQRLVYRDPALTTRVCVTTLSTVEAARCASGTDHDLLLLYT